MHYYRRKREVKVMTWADGILSRLSKPSAAISLAILLVFIIVAVFAPWIAPYGPLAISGQPFENPSRAHPLGTDDVGKDILTQVIYGARTSLMVAFFVSLAVLAIGTCVGVVSGYLGGATDRAFMRGVDIFLMIPELPLILLLAMYLSPSIWNVILILSALGWPVTARVVRTKTMSLKVSGVVDFARVSGGSAPYIIIRHIFPDLYPVAITTLVIQSMRAILSQSGLAFLGLGDPSYPSWGTLLRYAESYTSIFQTNAWIWWIVPAGLCISLVMLSLVMLGQSFEKVR
jgi:peptide/nickel transport system permease protein